MAGSVVVPDLEMMLMEKSLSSSRAHSSCQARVAGEEDLRALAGQVVVLALDQLNGRAGAEIAAADADHDENLAVFPDPSGSVFDAAHLVGVFKDRKIEPAQEIVAGTLAVFEQLMGGKDILFLRQKVLKGQAVPQIGNIYIQHKLHLSMVLNYFYIILYFPPENNDKSVNNLIFFLRRLSLGFARMLRVVF